MKKVISLMLSLVLLFSSVFFVSASDSKNESSSPAYPIVVVRGMEFNGLFVDYGTQSQSPCIVSPDAKSIVSLVAANLKSLMKNRELDVDSVLDFCDGMLGNMACDKNGDSVYNIGLATYSSFVADYPDLLREAQGNSRSEVGIVATAIDYYGAENVYYFTYDWRLDPLDTAEDLNVFIEKAKSDHNTDKVDLICCSMGGIVTDSYIYKFGSQSLHKCVFNSSTFCGAYVTNDLFRGKVLITEDMLFNFVSDKLDSQFLVKMLSKLGVFKFAADFATEFVDKYKARVYDEFLTDCFATMPAFWALVQNENYNECIEYMFPTDELKAEYSGLIARADKLQQMVSDMDEILLSLPANGVEVAVVASYGTQQIPVYESAQLQSDGTLDSEPMFGRAVCSFVGKTLGDDYIPEDESRLSPDRCVDLSNVLFPEYTWAIKGAPHVSGSHYTDMGKFIFWILTTDGQLTVDSNPDYPQFMISNGNEEISYF